MIVALLALALWTLASLVCGPLIGRALFRLLDDPEEEFDGRSD